MGFLTVTRREGESIRLTIDPGVDTDKLLTLLLRDGITIHMHRGQRDGHIRGNRRIRKKSYAKLTVFS